MALKDFFRRKRKPKKQRRAFTLTQEETDALALTDEERGELDISGGMEFRVGQPISTGPEREKFLTTLRERLRTFRDQGTPLTFEPGEMAEWQAMEAGPEREAAMARQEIGSKEGGRRGRQAIYRRAVEVLPGGLQDKIERMLDEGYSPEQIHEAYGVWPKARARRPTTEWDPELAKKDAGISASPERMRQAGYKQVDGEWVKPEILQREKKTALKRRGTLAALRRQAAPVNAQERAQAVSLAAVASVPGALNAALKVYAAKDLSPTLRTAALAAIAEDPERYAEAEPTGAELTPADQWKVATNIAAETEEPIEEVHERLFGRAAAGEGAPAAGSLTLRGDQVIPGAGAGAVGGAPRAVVAGAPALATTVGPGAAGAAPLASPGERLPSGLIAATPEEAQAAAVQNAGDAQRIEAALNAVGKSANYQLRARR